MAKESANQKGVDRRTVLKGVGAGAVSVGGLSGVASGHHPQELQGLSGVPSQVHAGESFSFTVDWASGHGGEACFVAAIGRDGNWREVARKRDQAEGGIGSDESTTMQANIPDDAQGTYTFRVSATEWATRGHCPDSGETAENGRYYVLHLDRELEVIACVEQSRGAENADPPGHDKDKGEPGGHAHDSDEDREMPGERQGHCKFD